MEFMKVIVPGKENQDIDVLINGEKNGKVGEILSLGRGYVFVSVDLPGAEEKTVNLCDTLENDPMIVEVNVL